MSSADQHHLASEKLQGLEITNLQISAWVTLNDCEFAWWHLIQRDLVAVVSLSGLNYVCTLYYLHCLSRKLLTQLLKSPFTSCLCMYDTVAAMIWFSSLYSARVTFSRP
jgi:hypothetical protein